MFDLDPKTLLVLVPALPLVGALVTVALGRVLGPRAHWPAVVSIAAAAVAAVTLLVGLQRAELRKGTVPEAGTVPEQSRQSPSNPAATRRVAGGVARANRAGVGNRP